MKLELKHLAPYLPYGLKIQSDGFVYELSGTILETCSASSGGKNIFNKIFLTDCDKPILRPLLDLTKDIEIEGKIQKPCNLFNFILETDKRSVEYSVSLHGEVVGGKQESSLSSITQTIFKENGWTDSIWHLDYHSYCLLFKHHFDVFGLIEKGLAIDINKI